jgi:hypothetical protein
MASKRPQSLASATAARVDSTSSRDLLLAALRLASSMATDPNEPPTTRMRALSEVRAIAVLLDAADAAVKPAGAWSAKVLTAV